MPRGWWVPHYPPEWVEHMARAIGNRAMRDVLQPPAPPPTLVKAPPPGETLPVPAPAGPLVPMPPRPRALWRRVSGLFEWRK